MSSTNILAVALVVAGAAACAPHVPPPSQRPSLAGRWILNPKESTASADTTAPARARSRETREFDGGEAGGGEWGGEAGEGSQGDTGYSARFDPAALAGTNAAVKRGARQIVIEQSDTLVHIGFADRSYFDVRTDGHHRKDIWRNVGLIESMARWTDAGLLLERKLDNHVVVDQTFSRPAGSNHLVVTTVIKGPASMKLRSRDIYDLAPAETAGP